MRRLCVFRGSSTGARGFGRALADPGIGLAFGGGWIGLMGVLADAFLDAGGQARARSSCSAPLGAGICYGPAWPTGPRVDS